MSNARSNPTYLVEKLRLTSSDEIKKATLGKLHEELTTQVI
jgi:hypothetical protein